MVHTLKLVIMDDNKHSASVSFTHDKTIHFGSLEFIADHFSSLSLSDKRNVSGVVFVGMTHSGSPSMHAILEDSVDEGNTTSSGGGSSGFPISRECNVVTLTVPITTMPPSEGTLMLLDIVIVPL
jgi:hypothetical protein